MIPALSECHQLKSQLYENIRKKIYQEKYQTNLDVDGYENSE